MLNDVAYGMIPVLLYPISAGVPRRYLLILHTKGHWGFPKGHKDPGESDLETAQRELQEETGLTSYSVVTDRVFTEQYQFINPKGIQVDKTVIYYLAQIQMSGPNQDPHVTIQADELADYRWCSYEQGLELMTYPASRQVLIESEAYLRQS